MRIIYQLASLALQLEASDVDDVPPAERRRIAAELRRAADLADRRGPAVPRSGVLAELRGGRQT